MSLYKKTTPLLLSVAAAFGGISCKDKAQDKGSFFGSGTPTAAFATQYISKDASVETAHEGIGYDAGFRFIDSGYLDVTRTGIIAEQKEGVYPLLLMAKFSVNAPEGKTLETTCTLNGKTIYSSKRDTRFNAAFNEVKHRTIIENVNSLGVPSEIMRVAESTRCTFKVEK